MKTVAIIGGGFSGTMAAVNLARLATAPSSVQLINSTHPMGRGVAYGTTRDEHVLNVAARNMSAVPDHPSHFLDWLRTRDDYRDIPEPQLRETFAPRRVYGDYLCSLLLQYQRPIDGRQPAAIHLVENEASDIVPQDDGRVQVVLRGSESVVADNVLLATGNQPPAAIGNGPDAFSHPAYCPDPWTDWTRQLPAPEKNIVVLGSGLTMVDVFLSLRRRNWSGTMVVISKNGMIPQAQFRGIEYPDFLPANPEQLGLSGIVELLEEHCRRLERLGENPGIIVDRLRPQTQRIWQKLSLDEKREFLARYAARWNVIRHRIAQPIHQRLTEAITDGRVRVVKGTAMRLDESSDGVQVTLRTRSGEEQTIEGGLVINCTGPNACFSKTDVPLFQNLLRRGMIRPDGLDMGMDVGPDFAAIEADGSKSKFLFAIGPLMKGTLWETTAVPELRGQAMRVAQLLVQDLAPVAPGQDYRFSVEEEHVIEYYI